MLGMVGLPWGCESHMGKLQTAQCPLLVKIWTRRHGDLFPDGCPQGKPWVPADSLLIYSDLQRHTQESPKTPATISHMCIQKLDLNFNILYPQGFVDFLLTKSSPFLCVHSVLMCYYVSLMCLMWSIFSFAFQLACTLGFQPVKTNPSLLQC